MLCESSIMGLCNSENFRLPNCRKSCIISFGHGALAQLGARLDGIEEVTGSNPVCSTQNREPHDSVVPGFFDFFILFSEILLSESLYIAYQCFHSFRVQAKILISSKAFREHAEAHIT